MKLSKPCYICGEKPKIRRISKHWYNADHDSCDGEPGVSICDCPSADRAVEKWNKWQTRIASGQAVVFRLKKEEKYIMTRKALEAFDPAKLGKGRAQCFEVRNRQTGYGEHHYFYRDHDGELFTVVAHRRDTCETAMKVWRELKRVNDQDLVQLCIQDPQTK